MSDADDVRTQPHNRGVSIVTCHHTSARIVSKGVEGQAEYAQICWLGYLEVGAHMRGHVEKPRSRATPRLRFVPHCSSELFSTLACLNYYYKWGPNGGLLFRPHYPSAIRFIRTYGSIYHFSYSLVSLIGYIILFPPEVVL